MNWDQALVLGLVQGLTEFLPVSSSGHLVLVQHLLGIRGAQFLFSVTVHAGTLTAVVWALRREVASAAVGVLLWPRAVRAWRRGSGPVPQPARLAAWLAVGTLPAAAAGLWLADAVESLFGSPRWVAFALAVTGLVLWVAEAFPDPAKGDVADRSGGGAGGIRWGPSSRRPQGGHGPPQRAGLYETGVWRALAVGVAQAVAIVPGISRSGMTVATGIGVGMEREAAARFSFLLSVPATAGAAALGLLKAASGELPSPGPGALAVGFVAAGVAGYVAISTFLEALRRGRLRWFSVYVWAVALASLLVER